MQNYTGIRKNPVTINGQTIPFSLKLRVCVNHWQLNAYLCIGLTERKMSKILKVRNVNDYGRYL